MKQVFYRMHLKLQRSQPTFGSIRFHVRKVEAEKGKENFSVSDLYAFYPNVERQLVRQLFQLDQDRQTTRENVWGSISKEIQLLQSSDFPQKYDEQYKCIVGDGTSLADVAAKIFV